MSDRASDIFLFPRMSGYFACSFMPKECKDYCVKGNVVRCSGLFWGTSWCMAFTSLCGFFVFEELETHRWENIILSEGCHLNNQVIFAYRTLFNIYLFIYLFIFHCWKKQAWPSGMLAELVVWKPWVWLTLQSKRLLSCCLRFWSLLGLWP